MISYALMGVIALAQLGMKEKSGLFNAFRMDRKAVLPLILSLTSSALAIKVLTEVVSLVDTAVWTTIDNGGVMILAASYSFLIFKEKATLNKILAMTLAVGSIVIFSL